MEENTENSVEDSNSFDDSPEIFFVEEQRFRLQKFLKVWLRRSIGILMVIWGGSLTAGIILVTINPLNDEANRRISFILAAVMILGFLISVVIAAALFFNFCYAFKDLELLSEFLSKLGNSDCQEEISRLFHRIHEKDKFFLIVHEFITNLLLSIAVGMLFFALFLAIILRPQRFPGSLFSAIIAGILLFFASILTFAYAIRGYNLKVKRYKISGLL